MVLVRDARQPHSRCRARLAIAQASTAKPSPDVPRFSKALHHRCGDFCHDVVTLPDEVRVFQVTTCAD